jgi:flagellar basal-body rod modification protein FlgD
MVSSVNSQDYLNQLQNPQAAPTSSDSLGQAEFLRLLIAQMKNQDPLKPMDNGQFMAELAQFNSLNELQRLNSSFNNFQSAMVGTQLNQASTLVGKTVMTPSEGVNYSGSGGQNLAVELDSATPQLDVKIYNATGQLVHQQTLTGLAKGVQNIRWSGLNDQGQQQPAGAYIAVASKVEDMRSTPVQMLTPSRVVSVNLSASGDMQLNLANGQQTAFSAIRQIAE